MKKSSIQKIRKIAVGTTSIIFAGFASAAGSLLPLTIHGASGSTATEIPAYAVDGSESTSWNSGGGAPQWIEIDLQKIRAVSRLRLKVLQWPEGNTVHNIYGIKNDGQSVYIGSIQKYTVNGEWLQLDSRWDTQFRYIRITTTSSTSWVAWTEIQAFDGGEVRESCSLAGKPSGYIVSSTENIPGSCPGYSSDIVFRFRDITNQPSGLILAACSVAPALPSGWSMIGSYRDVSKCPGYQNSSNGTPIDNVILIQKQ